MEFKINDILEPINGVGSNIRITGVNVWYEFSQVEFIDGEWITLSNKLGDPKGYVERYYRLSPKAERNKFIKDILK